MNFRCSRAGQMVVMIVVTVGIQMMATVPTMAQNSELNAGDYFNVNGNILISDQYNNRVIEVNQSGHIVWQFGGGPNDASPRSILGVQDVRRVGNLTLMAGTNIPPGVNPSFPDGVIDNRVILVDPYGDVVWQYGQFGIIGSGENELNTPVHCVAMPDHSILITDREFTGSSLWAIIVKSSGNTARTEFSVQA